MNAFRFLSTLYDQKWKTPQQAKPSTLGNPQTTNTRFTEKEDSFRVFWQTGKMDQEDRWIDSYIHKQENAKKKMMMMMMMKNTVEHEHKKSSLEEKDFRCSYEGKKI